MDKPLRILLVDDNPDDRALVARELRREFPGMKVDQAVDQGEFEEFAGANHYDLLITDYQLKWSNGLKVQQAMRERQPDCPVIMFTGTGSEQVAVEAMKNGLSDYVLKSSKHFARLPAAAKKSIEEAQRRRALREVEDRYRILFEDVPVGLCRLAPDGSFLEANPALARILGADGPAALLSLNILDLLMTDDRRQQWRALLETGYEISDSECLCHRLDGTPVWLSLNLRAARDRHGTTLYHEGVAEDITARKEAHDSLLREKNFSDTVIDSLPGVFYLFDADGKFLRWNRNFETVSEYSSEEIARMHPLDFVAQKKLFEARIRECFASGRVEVEAEIVTRGGAVIPYFFTGRLIVVGDRPCLAGVGIDITERRRAELESRLLQYVLQSVSGSPDLHSALTTVLRHVCDVTGWCIGETWLPAADGSRLERSPACYSSESGLDEFMAASINYTFAPGEGLPGRAWAQKQALWNSDVTQDPQFLRTREAGQAGIKAAMAIPVLADQAVVAVIVFFVREFREEDRHLLDLASAAVMQIGPLIQRWRAEEGLRQSEQLLRTVMETLPVGVWVADKNGKIVMGNPAGREVWGGARYVGVEQYGEYKGWWADSGKPIAPDEWALARAIVKGETSLNEVINIESFDGKRKTILNSAVPLRDSANRIIGVIAINHDVTDWRRAEEALRQSETQLRAIFEAEPECVKLVDADGTILQMNAVGLAMIEADNPAQAIGNKEAQLVLPEYRDAYRAFHDSVIRGNRGSLEFEITGLKGTQRWMETHAVPMTDGAGRTQLLGITRDITERKKNEARLNYMAHYDALTGLPNRTLFNDRLRQAMIDANRHERLVGVVFLDLDRFKNINDSLGHETGDVLLKAVGERLLGAVRKGDTVARLSGDEFTFVLADIGHVDDVARVAQKILDVFTNPFYIGDREFYVTASLGITLYPFDEKDAQGLLRNADVAMYRAKEAGRNSYQFYTTEMTAKAEEMLSLENDLRHAVERHELFLEYQPVVGTRDGGVIGVEALLRWRHPQRGPIPPMQFIPMAEETGLIVPIGEWVLRTACAQTKTWLQNGAPALRLAVNLSARQFQQVKLEAVVEKILHETGLPASALELEITETVIMQHAETTIATLKRLSTTGVTFAIDDFGTGYSSLSYLKRFPIDAVKIDRSFVRDIPGDPDDMAIAKAIVTMAHSLGIRVIAEGVETPEQLGFLREQECDAIQGYYFSRPVAPEEITRMLHEGGRLETGA